MALKFAVLAAMLGALAGQARADISRPVPTPFRLRSDTVLAGARPGWDYLAFDGRRGLLFINRRKAGVSVYDVKTRRVVASVADSQGSNHTTLLPQFNRGYTTNADGSSTIFRMSDFKTIGRLKLGEDADASFFDPVTGLLAFMMGGEKEITLVEGASGRIAGHIPMPAEELEASVADGTGRMFTAERDRNALAEVDLRTRRLVAEHPLPACEQPVGVAMDLVRRRVFVGCRGEKPVLAVFDAEAGREVTTLPLGHGNDGVVYDEASRRIFTTNGKDANLVIYDQQSADRYSLEQAVTTRPFARTLAFDPATQSVYTVTAQGWVDPSRPVNEEAGPFYPNVYFDDTFEVLAYTPR